MDNWYTELAERIAKVKKEFQELDGKPRLEIQRGNKYSELALLEAMQEMKPPEKLKWEGSDREFGDWILNAFHDGKLSAKSNRNALEQALTHFEMKDGKRRTVNSLLQNLRNRKNEGK